MLSHISLYLFNLPVTVDFDCLSDQKRQDIYKWLAAPDPYANHFASRKRCQPRTGSWLLNSKMFEYWLSSSKPFLWLYGIRTLSFHDCFYSRVLMRYGSWQRENDPLVSAFELIS